MNYYAQGGQAHGLKSIAQELQDMGRGGDTILAHINPQEAAMLKRMGGSGTINPQTGLPEYFVKGVVRAVTKPIQSVAKAVEKAVIRPVGDVLKPILPYVQYVAPFIPGVGPLAAAGLGALGSGFAGGGGFNFKRGLMGGMTAYGLSNLYAGMQAAGGAGTSGASAATAPPPVELGVPGTEVVAGEVAQTGLSTPGAFDQVMAGDFSGAASTVGQNIGEGISSAYNTVTDPNTYSGFTDRVGTQMSDAGQGLKNLVGVGDTTMSAADAATAFGNKAGIGSGMAVYGGVTGQAALDEFDEMKLQAELEAAETEQERAIILDRIADGRRRAEEAVRNNPYQFAEGGEVPDSGFRGSLSGFRDSLNRFTRRFSNPTPDAPSQEQRLLDAQRSDLASAGIKQEILSGADPTRIKEYYTSLYGSDRKPTGFSSSSSSRPSFGGFRFNRLSPPTAPSTQVPAPTDDQRLGLVAMVNNPYQFAYGGSVDDELGFDDFNDYMSGGVASMAKGGMAPRFLSGGGDGMSDDIKATINGKQPARLADGEFVIPADVVSHLGNGSSKAGAKQLYSMMDKVRTARTGNKKQGKQINPAKYMPA
jgi:hypothetical protein